MAIAQNGKGNVTYKCRHRGQGCPQPARSAKGLTRAVVLGMRLLGHDERLQGAIRRQMTGGTRTVPDRARRGRRQPAAEVQATLATERSKLLQLYYAGAITTEGFKEEEQRLVTAVEAARERAGEELLESQGVSELEQRFEQVVELLQGLDIDVFWAAATDEERRVLVHELLEAVTVFPDHLEVKLHGAPVLNVLLGEVGLKVPEIVGVGGPTQQFCNQALAA